MPGFKIFVSLLLVIGLAAGAYAQPASRGVKSSGRAGSTLKSDARLEKLKKEGLALVRQQKWPEAAAAFENIALLYPNDLESGYWLSLAYYNLQRTGEAEAKLRTLIDKLNSKTVPSSREKQVTADALVLSALILVKARRNQAAIEALMTAIRKIPEHFDAHLTLGRLYFGEGRLAESIAAFKKATQLRPAEQRARFFLATALEQNGELDAALAEYRSILRVNPDSPDGNLGLGVLLLKSYPGRVDEGIVALRKALSANGDLYEARIVLGKTLIKTGALDEAVAHLRKASELNPGNPEPHFQLSIAYKKMGRKAEADEQAAIVKRIHESRRGVTAPQ